MQQPLNNGTPIRNERKRRITKKSQLPLEGDPSTHICWNYLLVLMFMTFPIAGGGYLMYAIMLDPKDMVKTTK